MKYNSMTDSLKTAKQIEQEAWELSPETIKELELLIKDIEYIKERKIVDEETYHKVNAVFQQISGFRDHITVRVFNILKRGDKIN
tara:strand:+ start:232 stop:486 length:255 start_codon:yes stop_codon:yes gene_type:complete